MTARSLFDSQPSRVVGRRRPLRTGPVTVEELERARRFVAKLILDLEDETYMPIFDRLDAELAARQGGDAKRVRLKAIAAGEPHIRPLGNIPGNSSGLFLSPVG